MKPAIALAFLAALALGIAAWRYNVSAERLAEERRSLEALRADIKERQASLSDSLQQAQQQTEALNAAVEKSENYQQEQRTLASRGVTLANALNTAQSMKVAITEFYLTEGKWPRANADIGMPAPATFANGDVRSVAVRPNGRIELTIASGTLFLQGAANQAQQIIWKCVTDSIPDIARLAPDCTYRAK
jgi:hypothetical protein